MKKTLLAIALCVSPALVMAAQTPVTPIGAFANPAQTSINTLRDATDVKIGIIEINRQDHEARIAAAETSKSSMVMLWSEYGAGASFTTSSPPVAYNGELYKCIAPYTKTVGEYPDTQTKYFAEVTGSSGAGDIEGVTAGTGLSGGGASGDVTISADTNYLQRRVSYTCSAGSSIREIAVDGAVTCETDDTGSGSVPSGTVSGQVLIWATDQWLASTAPWLTTASLGTGVTTALGYAPDSTGGFATKASLDLKADSTGISFIASALSDLKILTTAQPINGENIVSDSVLYGDTEDNLRLWSIEKIGSQLATKIGTTGVTYEQLNINGDVGTSAGQLAIGNHTHTGVYQPADTDIQKDAIVMHFVSDSVIAAGHEVDVRVPVPWNATITKSSVVCKEAGAIVIDVWKDNYANYPPTVADTITASAKPTTATSRTSQDTTLIGWTTAVAAGDMLIGHVDSNATNTECTLTLEVTK